ncbi:hypothetical protein LINPERHAP1_LOCUS31403 [Linum perenne]
MGLVKNLISVGLGREAALQLLFWVIMLSWKRNLHRFREQLFLMYNFLYLDRFVIWLDAHDYVIVYLSSM